MFHQPSDNSNKEEEPTVFGHIMWFGDNSLIEKIFLNILGRKSGNWLKGTRRDPAEIELIETDTRDRNNYRWTIAEFYNFRVVKTISKL